MTHESDGSDTSNGARYGATEPAHQADGAVGEDPG